MKPPALILSAAYISETLHGHLGRIRTSRLPVGGRSLVELNCENFSENFDPYVAIHYADNVSRAFLNIKLRNIISVDGDASLTKALSQSLKYLISIYKSDFPIQLVFGDTSIEPVQGHDFISVVANRDDFSDWTTVRISNKELSFHTPGLASEKIVAGYFGLGSACGFYNILEKRGDFYESLQEYNSLVSKLSLQDSNAWFDFGRVNTFYLSRMSLLNSRSFNSISADQSRNIVRKSSTNTEKIRQEIDWFLALPRWNLEEIAPRLRDFSVTEGWYETDYCLQPNMAEIFIFAEKSLGYWNRFFASLLKYFEILHSRFNRVADSDQLERIRSAYLDKLKSRMRELRMQNPSLFEIDFLVQGNRFKLQDFVQSIEKFLVNFEPIPIDFIHGDFFFGNMFFLDELNRLLVIDPRGRPSQTSISDLYYEFAKLCHSIYGGYDFLAADLFLIRKEESEYRLSLPWQDFHHQIQVLASEFLGKVTNQLTISLENVRILHSFLFLTLAPLHSENKERQTAAILRAIEIYTDTPL